MTDTIADEPFVSNTKNRLMLSVVTIDDKEYTIDKDDIFVALAEAHPELRPHVVAMFDRAGDKLAAMRYPRDLDKLPVDERTLGFVAGLLDLMPVETEAQFHALDRAVATITDHCDEKALAIHRLTKETSENL